MKEHNIAGRVPKQKMDKRILLQRSLSSRKVYNSTMKHNLNNFPNRKRTLQKFTFIPLLFRKATYSTISSLRIAYPLFYYMLYAYTFSLASFEWGNLDFYTRPATRIFFYRFTNYLLLIHLFARHSC